VPVHPDRQRPQIQVQFYVQRRRIVRCGKSNESAIQAYTRTREFNMSVTEAAVSTQSHQDPKREEYDLVILGGGTGSTVAAWTFAAEGKTVAVIDRKYIGGSCPNIACLPSKNVIHSARVASYVRHSEAYGIHKENVRVDMSAVRDRKRKMVSDLNALYLDNYKKTGAELLLASGRFVAPQTIEAQFPDGTRRLLRGTNVIISTGTRATLDPIPGLIDAQPLTHVEALELDHLPQHLIVLGGGYVGVELAQAMRRFGSKVTVVERNDRLLFREDDDVAQTLAELFKDEGIDLVLGAKVTGVSGKSGESVAIRFTQNGVDRTIDGTHLLVASGRTPNTEALGLAIAGVALTSRGYIQVNERLQTTAPGVWAIGEVAGSPQFTHVSIDDFRVVHDNLSGRSHVTTGRQIPFCVFTDPEIARIGLSEKEAAAQGLAYRLFKVPMDAVLRAKTLSETRGFLKALVDVKTDRILGFTAFGVEGGETMSAVQIAIIGGLPYTALRDAILAHPTLAEGLEALFSSEPQQRNARTQTASL
jgi:pyruvate/2-oxoglutarate dehydrogenase complex dihydrolipoamide dehydrogenase (E3) component